MPPSAKRALGAVAILAYLAGYIVLVASFASFIGALPIWVQAILYAAAGLVWVVPLKPVFIWMGAPGASDREPAPKPPAR